MTVGGIYYDVAQRELIVVLDEEVEHAGEGWIPLTPEPWCGLIDARRLLVERGLLDDMTAQRVFWRMESTDHGTTRPAA